MSHSWMAHLPFIQLFLRTQTGNFLLHLRNHLCQFLLALRLGWGVDILGHTFFVDLRGTPPLP